MRTYVINYIDKVMGRPGEIYTTTPVQSNLVGPYKESLGMLGCDVVSVTPVKENV